MFFIVLNHYIKLKYIVLLKNYSSNVKVQKYEYKTRWIVIHVIFI